MPPFTELRVSFYGFGHKESPGHKSGGGEKTWYLLRVGKPRTGEPVRTAATGRSSRALANEIACVDLLLPGHPALATRFPVFGNLAISRLLFLACGYMLFNRGSERPPTTSPRRTRRDAALCNHSTVHVLRLSHVVRSKTLRLMWSTRSDLRVAPLLVVVAFGFATHELVCIICQPKPDLSKCFARSIHSRGTRPFRQRIHAVNSKPLYSTPERAAGGTQRGGYPRHFQVVYFLKLREAQRLVQGALTTLAWCGGDLRRAWPRSTSAAQGIRWS